MTAREKLNRWLEETAWIDRDPELGSSAMRWAPEEPKPQKRELTAEDDLWGWLG